MKAEFKRTGMNGAEAALLRMLVERGRPARLLEGLEPGAAEELRELAERVESADEERREAVLEAWAETDDALEPLAERGEPPARGRWAKAVRRWRRGEPFDWLESKRMRRALAGLLEQWRASGRLDLHKERICEEPAHFDALLSMEIEEFREFVGAFGTYQLAEILRGENRRRVARVSRQLSEERRDLLVAALKRERETVEDEERRLREVFVTLTRHHEELAERVFELGLYSVAAAAGYRFRDRIEYLAGELPEALAERLERYYRLSYGSTRRGIGRHFRAALESFLVWRRE